MSRFSMSLPLRTALLWSLAVGAVPAMADTAAGFVEEARQYLSEGEVKSAEIQLKNALQADPSLVEARLMLGQLHLAAGRAAEAEKEYDRAARLGASPDQWMVPLGRALFMLGRHEELLERVDPSLLGDESDKAEATVLQGLAELSLGRRDAAREYFSYALELQPEHAGAGLGLAQLQIMAGDRDEAFDALNAIVATHPDNAEALMMRGELLRQRGRLDDARADLEKSIALEPRTVRTSVVHAFTVLAQRDTQAALEDVARIRKYSPKLPLAGYLHGLAAFLDGDYELAHTQLQGVIEAVPGDTRTQLLLGLTKYASGDFQLAEDYLTSAASKLPPNVEIAKVLGAARIKLRQPKRALEALQPAAEQAPEDAQLAALLGNAYLLAGENAKGAEYLTRAVELNPDQATFRTQLAISRLVTGQTDAAVSELETAVDLGADLIQADVLLVLSYIKKGDQENAVKAAAELEVRKPDSPLPFNLSGLALLAGNQFDAAEAKFVKALEIDPAFVAAEINRARLDLAQGDLAAAKAHYQDVLDRSAKHLGAMLALAGIAEREGDREGAIAWLDKAHQANPAALRPVLLLAEYYLREREPLKALNLVNTLGDAQARNPAVLRITGMAHLQSGDAVSAIASFEALTEAEPDVVESWFQMGRAQHAAGKGSDALKSFERARSLDVRNAYPLVHTGLVELLIAGREYDRALAEARQMQQHFPQLPSGFELEAAALAGQGDRAAAIVALQRAYDAGPSAPRARRLASLYAGAGDLTQAESILRGWLSKAPEDGATWKMLGGVLQGAGRDDEAAEPYEKALELQPDDAALLNNMAWLYYRSDATRALSLAQKAYRLAPETPEILDTYGWVLFQSGERKKGLDYLQQALVAAPRNAEISLHVATAMHELGRNEEARPILQRVLRDHPGSSYEREARQLLEQLPSG